MQLLPQAAKKVFWDVETGFLDMLRHKTFVIERILEYGDEKATQWLLKKFSRKAILTVLEQSRRLSPKSRNFWNIKLAHGRYKSR